MPPICRSNHSRVRKDRFDSVVAMSDDRFLVFGLFGELAMIATLSLGGRF